MPDGVGHTARCPAAPDCVRCAFLVRPAELLVEQVGGGPRVGVNHPVGADPHEELVHSIYPFSLFRRSVASRRTHSLTSFFAISARSAWS